MDVVQSTTEVVCYFVVSLAWFFNEDLLSNGMSINNLYAQVVCCVCTTEKNYGRCLVTLLALLFSAM